MTKSVMSRNDYNRNFELLMIAKYALYCEEYKTCESILTALELNLK